MRMWLENIGVGRWRSLWRGDPKGPHQGERERRRRRLRILGLKGAPYSEQEFYRDWRTTIEVARATEYPLTYAA